jgi:hypothetical protein
MRHFLLPMLAACLWLAPSCGKAGEPKAQGAAMAVVDFEYSDTSGEVRDQRQEHETRLNAFMRALRSDLAERGKVRLVTVACGTDPCALARATPGDLLGAAREAGADILLIGGIHKQSTLVQWAKVELIDVKTGRTMLDKLFTFRGDTDEAWRRAEAFISNDIIALSPF